MANTIHHAGGGHIQKTLNLQTGEQAGRKEILVRGWVEPCSPQLT